MSAIFIKRTLIVSWKGTSESEVLIQDASGKNVRLSAPIVDKLTMILTSMYLADQVNVHANESHRQRV